MTIGDRFEELIEKGEITFREAKIQDLPSAWARSVVHLYIERSNLTWKLGDKVVDGAICVQIDDFYLRYVDIMEDGTFMFCKEGHHDSVHPDEVSAYLITEHVLGRRYEKEM